MMLFLLLQVLAGSTFDLNLKNNHPVFDPISMQSSKENVFVAGGLSEKHDKDLFPY